MKFALFIAIWETFEFWTFYQRDELKYLENVVVFIWEDKIVIKRHKI